MKRYRSAVDGAFITRAKAAQNPATTVAETVKHKGTKVATTTTRKPKPTASVKITNMAPLPTAPDLRVTRANGVPPSITDIPPGKTASFVWAVNSAYIVRVTKQGRATAVIVNGRASGGAVQPNVLVEIDPHTTVLIQPGTRASFAMVYPAALTVKVGK